ncbi:uncharacterized protein LOC108042560 [Drosophila rhopaloa]|uniref:Uncharacterized protein LOC108042560 n=1 Tax=Drosophila rhopaloa TaxID=1041015 RepID=A0A6P4EDX9_DRORH|nr:uncharacterized protein LOC108042560 [Drosophila rhopaloa]
MTQEDYKIVKAFMKDDFFKSEPLWQADGETSDYPQNAKYHLSMIAQGTCLVALDESNGGRLVGFVLAGAQYLEDIEKHRMEADVMEKNVLGSRKRSTPTLLVWILR